MNVAFLALVGAIFLFAARPILSVLSKDPVTIDYGVLCLRALAVGFAFFGFGMVTIQAFNGAGDTKTPMKINISAFWLFKIPLAFVLARLTPFPAL